MNPPNVSLLSCIQSIQSMSEVQVRQCLQFYGHNNSLSIQDLFVSLGVEIKSFVNDINKRGKLDNSVQDNQYLTLFLNEDGVYPRQGRMVSGLKKVELDRLRGPYNRTLGPLLQFYHILHENSSFERKLNLLLMWLGYPINFDLLANTNMKLSNLDGYVNQLRHDNRRINNKINNMDNKINNIDRRLRNIEKDTTTIKDEIVNIKDELRQLVSSLQHSIDASNIQANSQEVSAIQARYYQEDTPNNVVKVVSL